MSLSYCVGLVYRHTVLFVRGVELSNDVEADALVKLSVKCLDRRRIVTHTNRQTDTHTPFTYTNAHTYVHAYVHKDSFTKIYMYVYSSYSTQNPVLSGWTDCCSEGSKRWGGPNLYHPAISRAGAHSVFQLHEQH